MLSYELGQDIMLHMHFQRHVVYLSLREQSVNAFILYSMLNLTLHLAKKLNIALSKVVVVVVARMSSVLNDFSLLL